MTVATSSSPPLSLVQVGGFGESGDQIYRLHQPAAALAGLPGVAMYEVHLEARHRDAAVLAADVAILTMTLDVEVFRLIHQRRQLGRPTICELNDYLPDVQPWNPAHRSWSDPRALRFFLELCGHCDAVQVTTEALARRLALRTRQVVVFPNQLAELPPPRSKRTGSPPSAERPLVSGWGGSFGHLEDLRSIAPPLIGWLQQHRHVRLEVMGDPRMAEPFRQLSADRFRFQRAGSLEHYLSWLETVDIGLAPLLPTAYNRCRSDVKFLEYASRGVVPLLQRLDPYLPLADGPEALLFSDQRELLARLDHLHADPALRQSIVTAAYAHVRAQRLLEQHAPRRLCFYRNLAAATYARRAAELNPLDPPQAPEP